VGVVITVVNASSVLLEAQRDGDVLDPRAPFLWEFSSWALIVGLAPLVGAAIQRLPPSRADWPRFLLGHAALTIPFSLVHVAGMVAIRKLGYALAGASYDFAHGALARELFYEWRKDVLTYALLAATYYIFQRRPAPIQAAPGENRIEIRDGGTALFLAPEDILYLEAAGNYVQFHTAARPHLVRGTLASWEARLSPRGFARVHRSRLVNRARIGALRPTPSGDIEITLDDGRTLLGSRRYRAALETAPSL
jgi:DNA-binding LytR/AlgR family response regulator